MEITYLNLLWREFWLSGISFYSWGRSVYFVWLQLKDRCKDEIILWIIREVCPSCLQNCNMIGLNWISCCLSNSLSDGCGITDDKRTHYITKPVLPISFSNCSIECGYPKKFQEVNFSEEQIQSSEALAEMSQGNWEGCHQSEIYTPEILGIIDRFQPDFTPPSGESLRQVEFRMIDFLNRTVPGLSEKLRLDLSSHQNESQAFAPHNAHALTNSIHDQDGPSLHPTQWDLLHRHRPGISRKKSGKSRLQVVTTTGDEIEDEVSPSEANHQNPIRTSSFSSFSASFSCIGIFTHSVPIKCLLTGILGCSPLMSHKICIEDSSVTVLQHSLKTGWQIKRLNDTAHLRLL